jgi:hypothetical protein
MGLRLDTAEGLRETAVRRVAQQTDTGPYPGRTLIDPPRFGVGMALIDPGSPATSYLLYKLLRNPDNYGGEGVPCATKYAVALPQGTCAPSPGELTLLGEWFVRLDPMPPLGEALAGGIDDLRLLQRFVSAGADTRRCE